ncbi:MULTISPECIES: hypothetical protein [Nonomuraea]|uniref:YVTN family beta-propeller protein n=1 Tax=Nonomuraea ferruginea TaxID=46174 RepID=A0ABT4T1V6_9ACTN|nr:hypothetical protein [Nonomuraea ferruginea]MDA0643493.1 hypothetical protein [Nonomuraea ferruginea]
MTMTTGLVTAVAPVASAADSMTELGFINNRRGNSDVAAGGGKVFVSGNDRIVVADTSGELVGAITDLAGPAGLAAAPDGTRVYAALYESHEVIEIDTATLAVTRRIDFAAHPCPVSLSLSGDVLWTAYGCDRGVGGVAGLDVSAPAPQPVAVVTGRYTPPLIAAAGNTLVLGDSRVEPVDLQVYDVSAGSVELRGEIDEGAHAMTNLRDLAVTPDGSKAVLTFSDRYETWDTTSLTRVRVYGEDMSAQGYAAAVAVSPDGSHIVGGWTTRGVELYDVATGATTYSQKSPTGWPNPVIISGGVTVAGDDVFAVLWVPGSERLRLWRLEDATLVQTTMTLTAPEEATALEPLTLTGRVTRADGAAPGRQRLEVSHRLPDGTSTALRRARTAADGTFTITVTPPVAGTVGYDVNWPGAAGVRGSTASVAVMVSLQSAFVTLTGPVDGVVGKRLRFKGELKFGDQAPTTRPSLTVMRESADGVVEDLGTVRVARNGSFRFDDRPDQEGRYIYGVWWDGDDATEHAGAARHVTVRPGNG